MPSKEIRVPDTPYLIYFALPPDSEFHGVVDDLRARVQKHFGSNGAAPPHMEMGRNLTTGRPFVLIDPADNPGRNVQELGSEIVALLESLGAEGIRTE